MERDLAIVYKSELYKVNKIINRLKGIGLDTTNYERLVSKIDNECSENNKRDLEKSINTPFMIDYLEANYSKAINELKNIEYELSKYEVYLKVNSLTNILELAITNKSLNTEELEKLVPELINVLNSLKKSNTLNYSTEGNVVESIYKVTYYLLKEEISLGKDNLFNALKSDEVHTMYLDKEISLELDTLDKNDSKNNAIFKRKNAIDLSGINSHYLDYELLSLITGKIDSQKNIEEINKLLKSCYGFEEKLKSYKSDLKYANYGINQVRNKIKFYGKPSSYIKNIGSMILSASIITTIFGGAHLLARKGCTHINSTTISTYDTRDNSENTTEPFYSDKTEGTIITKYEPYQKKSDGFYRYVTTYDLGDNTDLSNEEILNLDFAKLYTSEDKEEEYKDTLTYEDIYDNTYYIISKTNVDKNNYKLERSDLVFYTILWEIPAFFTYVVLAATYCVIIDDIPIGLISGARNIKNDLELLVTFKKYEKKHIEKRNKIIEDIKKLITTYDKEIRELFRYADFICEYGNDKVSDDLRETLKNINREFDSIFEYEGGIVIKNSVENMKVKKLSK